MSQGKTMTIALPSSIVSVVEAAVASGDYASSSDIICEALQVWQAGRPTRAQELVVLKSEIERGLTDLAENRVQDFDAARVIEQGKQLSTARSVSG